MHISCIYLHKNNFRDGFGTQGTVFICDRMGFVWGKKLNIYFLKEFQMSHHLFFICCFYRFKYLTKLLNVFSEVIVQ